MVKVTFLHFYLGFYPGCRHETFLNFTNGENEWTATLTKLAVLLTSGEAAQPPWVILASPFLARNEEFRGIWKKKTREKINPTFPNHKKFNFIWDTFCPKFQWEQWSYFIQQITFDGKNSKRFCYRRPKRKKYHTAGIHILTKTV